jgi:hypothetical protein
MPVLRHPARNYIHYLLSRQNTDIRGVVEILSDQRIPIPQENEKFQTFLRALIATRKNMMVPAGFDPLAPLLSDTTLRFLNKWGITSLWREDQFAVRARDLLKETHIRRGLEVMLLGPVSPRDIARRLCQRYDITDDVINTRVVREYGHYFWDQDSLDQAEWRSFLFDHYPKYAHNADYAVALQSPRSSEGALLVMNLSDRGADAMTDTQVYTMMRNATALHFMQHALLERPTPGRALSVMQALTSFKMAADELERRQGADVELIDELRKFKTVYDRNPVATINDLPVERNVVALPPPSDEPSLLEKEPTDVDR